MAVTPLDHAVAQGVTVPPATARSHSAFSIGFQGRLSCRADPGCPVDGVVGDDRDPRAELLLDAEADLDAAGITGVGTAGPTPRSRPDDPRGRQPP
jgi:hypothetical protein